MMSDEMVKRVILLEEALRNVIRAGRSQWWSEEWEEESPEAAQVRDAARLLNSSAPATRDDPYTQLNMIKNLMPSLVLGGNVFDHVANYMQQSSNAYHRVGMDRDRAVRLLKKWVWAYKPRNGVGSELYKDTRKWLDELEVVY